MRVQLDNERQSVDLEAGVHFNNVTMLDLVLKALDAIGYTRDDVKEHIEELEYHGR